MGGDAESGKVLRAVHKKVVDQQLGSALKLLGAAKSAHRHEDGVVEELVSKQPKPTSGRTTKEEYDEGVRLGAAGDGDGGGAAGSADGTETVRFQCFSITDKVALCSRLERELRRRRA